MHRPMGGKNQQNEDTDLSLDFEMAWLKEKTKVLRFPFERRERMLPYCFSRDMVKSHACKPGFSTPGSHSRPAGIGVEQKSRCCQCQAGRLSTLEDPGKRRLLAEFPEKTWQQALTPGVLLLPLQAEASKASNACSPAPHLNNSIHGKRSNRQGVLALLFTTG